MSDIDWAAVEQIDAWLDGEVAHTYVALGHLHRQQEIPAPCPAFYSGSPLAIDFGEEGNGPAALIVTARPGVRAGARRVDVRGGRTLKTLRGWLDHVIAEGEQASDAYLRVILAEKARAGLGDGRLGKCLGPSVA